MEALNTQGNMIRYFHNEIDYSHFNQQYKMSAMLYGPSQIFGHHLTLGKQLWSSSGGPYEDIVLVAPRITDMLCLKSNNDIEAISIVEG